MAFPWPTNKVIGPIFARKKRKKKQKAKRKKRFITCNKGKSVDILLLAIMFSAG